MIAPIEPILEKKLWSSQIDGLRRLGYEFPPTILAELMQLGDELRYANVGGHRRIEAMRAHLEAARINIPFKHICICGHEHP